METLDLFMCLLALLATHFPEFSQRLSCSPGFSRILSTIVDFFRGDCLTGYHTLPTNTLMIFNRVLSSASDVTRVSTAEQLLACGAVDTCCTFLKHFLVSHHDQARTPYNPRLSPHTLVKLLHFLCTMITTSDTLPDSVGPDRNGETPRNPFVAKLIECRGLQTFELLRYDDCVQADDRNPVLHELKKLSTLLVSMGLIVPDTDSTEKLRLQAVVETREFVQSQNDWQTVFDKHIECCLVECGYPRRVAFHFGT